jgi:hypothetical protein
MKPSPKYIGCMCDMQIVQLGQGPRMSISIVKDAIEQ